MKKARSWLLKGFLKKGLHWLMCIFALVETPKIFQFNISFAGENMMCTGLGDPFRPALIEDFGKNKFILLCDNNAERINDLSISSTDFHVVATGFKEKPEYVFAADDILKPTGQDSSFERFVVSRVPAKGFDIEEQIEGLGSGNKEAPWRPFLRFEVRCNIEKCTVSRGKCLLAIPPSESDHRVVQEGQKRMKEAMKLECHKDGIEEKLGHGIFMKKCFADDIFSSRLLMTALSGNHEAGRILEDLLMALVSDGAAAEYYNEALAVLKRAKEMKCLPGESK